MRIGETVPVSRSDDRHYAKLIPIDAVYAWYSSAHKAESHFGVRLLLPNKDTIRILF